MAKAKKKAPAKKQQLKCPIPLPATGLQIWIENQRYEVIGENKVKDRDGKEYDVV